LAIKSIEQAVDFKHQAAALWLLQMSALCNVEVSQIFIRNLIAIFIPIMQFVLDLAAADYYRMQ